MRRKSIAALVLLALALLFGFLGRSTETDALFLLSGMLFLSALGIWISFLPFWQSYRDRVPRMPGLFPRVGPGEWDPVTGQPGPARRRRK